MTNGFLIFHFNSGDDPDKVLLEGPWVIDDAVLALGSWTLEFRPSVADLPKCVVWMRHF